MKNAVSIKFYVGANNETKAVEKAKALVIAGRHYKGFTVTESIGLWMGEVENSIIIEVIEVEDGSQEIAERVERELKEELNQYSVLFTITNIKANI